MGSDTRLTAASTIKVSIVIAPRTTYMLMRISLARDFIDALTAQGGRSPRLRPRLLLSTTTTMIIIWTKYRGGREGTAGAGREEEEEKEEGGGGRGEKEEEQEQEQEQEQEEQDDNQWKYDITSSCKQIRAVWVSKRSPFIFVRPRAECTEQRSEIPFIVHPTINHHIGGAAFELRCVRGTLISARVSILRGGRSCCRL